MITDGAMVIGGGGFSQVRDFRYDFGTILVISAVQLLRSKLEAQTKPGLYIALELLCCNTNGTS